MDLQDFYNWLKLNYNSKKTIKDYYQQVNKFFSEYNEMTKQNVEKYMIKYIDEGKSVSTVNKINFSLRKYAEFKGLNIEFPKKKRIKKRPIKFYFSEKDMLKVYKNLPLWTNNCQEFELILKFMFYSGARTSEVLNIKKSDLKFNDNKIIFYNAKGDKDRSVPFINKELKNKLSLHCNNIQDKVFNVSREQIEYLFRKIKKELNLENEVVEPRTMRISFAKHCISRCVNLLYLKRWMGHSDIRVTELYSEPDEKMSDEEGKRLREGE